MNKTLKTNSVAMLLLCALNAFLGIVSAHAQKCEQPPSIRFSMIPLGDVEREIRRYQPLLKRIEKLTNRPVIVVRPTSYASVVEGLLGGSVDVAALGSATYIEARKGDGGITPFATTEKRKGEFQVKGPYYHSLLVVLDGSRFEDLAAIKGSRLSLTDPGSTSGSLLPRKLFAPLLGVPLEKYFGTVSFSGSHGNSLHALLKEEVDAAFIASAELERAKAEHRMSANQLRILWTSEPIPYDPFVYRGQLCEPLRKQIRDAFIGEGATKELRELLDLNEAERFISIDDSHYQGIRKVLGP